MNWLSKITNGIGSLFGDATAGDELANFLPDFGLGGTGKGDSLWPSLIGAGTSLAGTYFGLDQQKNLAEQYAAQQQAQNAISEKQFEEKLAADKELAGIAAGAHIKAAAIAAGAQKKNTLANMYNNWAALTEKGGEALGQSALDTGRNVISAITPRSSVLR